MKLKSLKYALFMACIVTNSVKAGDEFPGIKNLMTVEEFENAGLIRQSEEELKALNDWLIRYTAEDAAHLKKRVAAVKKAAGREINSRIAGTFYGWSGDTRFILENGQVWEQRLKGSWKTEIDNPEVSIDKNFFGFYVMKIKGHKKRIGVNRIE